MKLYQTVAGTFGLLASVRLHSRSVACVDDAPFFLKNEVIDLKKAVLWGLNFLQTH